MDSQKITSIEELLEASKGAVVELPPFAEGTQFFARLKRPSLLKLVKNHQIPNELLNSANSLFLDGGQGLKNEAIEEDMLDKLLGVMEIICDASFIEPSYQELKENGIELTDDQLLFVFNYSQNGVNALKSFR